MCKRYDPLTSGSRSECDHQHLSAWTALDGSLMSIAAITANDAIIAIAAVANCDGAPKATKAPTAINSSLVGSPLKKIRLFRNL